VAQVGIRELLEAGVHFGHQTRRWNPKMRRFIHGERGGIYVIDLIKTATLLEQAQRFASEIAHRGGTVLFVGTKKQARDGVKEIAEAAGQPYVNHRWLGGLLTNYQTISQRIKRLHDLERYETEGQLELLPTRERMAALADLEKLRANLGGVKNMQRVPDAVFVIDLKTEEIAVREAQRLRIPIIGLVDTNCDPDGIDYVVPGNDDAIRSCLLITQAIGEVVASGHAVFRAEEERARREAEEQARREAEERARREAEEQARREAEEQARREAEEQARRDLTEGGTGQPREAAEATVREAVDTLGRPRPDGRDQPAADAAAEAAEAEQGEREGVDDAGARGRTPQPTGQPAPVAEPPAPSEIASEAMAEQPPATPGQEAAAADPRSGGEADTAEEEAAADRGEADSPVDAARDIAAAAAETAQDAAGAAAETAQDAAGAAAETAQQAAASAAETVQDVAGGIAGAVRGAVQQAAEAVQGADDDEGHQPEAEQPEAAQGEQPEGEQSQAAQDEPPAEGEGETTDDQEGARG
jgi:small subunit ribosomal protein S2